jgi:hypothetical protein
MQTISAPASRAKPEVGHPLRWPVTAKNAAAHLEEDSGDRITAEESEERARPARLERATLGSASAG